MSELVLHASVLDPAGRTGRSVSFSSIDKEFSRADNWSSLMKRVAPFLFLAVGLLVVEPGAAQNDSIAGVWRAREESPSRGVRR